MPSDGSDAALDGALAMNVFGNFMTRSRALPVSMKTADRRRVDLACALFEAKASPAEVALRTPNQGVSGQHPQAAAPAADAGQRRRVLKGINDLVVDYIAHLFALSGDKRVPVMLKSHDPLLVSAIQNRKTEVAKHDVVRCDMTDRAMIRSLRQQLREARACRRELSSHQLMLTAWGLLGAPRLPRGCRPAFFLGVLSADAPTVELPHPR